jgi:hypothetical protein
MSLALHRDQGPGAILPALETLRVREVPGESTPLFVYEYATDSAVGAKTAFEHNAVEFAVLNSGL